MALITQSASGQTFSSLLAPFTGVNNGTTRLLKAISATELATLREGDLVYVESVRDYWKWLPNSTIADDGVLVTYCKPTVLGIGNGIFERLFICSPDWTFQTDWFFDELNSSGLASNENDGSTALTPILNLGEFNNRHNSNTIWRSNTAYHFRFISNPTSTYIINGFFGINTVWYFQNITDRTGILPALYSGVVDVLDTLNPATNIPWAITSNGLAVNWTGLIDKRIRLTSGASINAYSWPTLQTATPKKARCAEFLIPVASFAVSPFVGPATTTAGPTVGDTFVVEDLRTIPRIEINLHSAPGNNPSTSKVVIESLAVTTLVLSPSCGLYIDGSQVGTNIVRGAATSYHQCKITGLLDDGIKNIIGGYNTTVLVLINHLATVSTITRFTIQGDRNLDFVGGGCANSQNAWDFTQIGIFDSTAAPLRFINRNANWNSASLLYGSGNVGSLFSITPNSIVLSSVGSYAGLTVVPGVSLIRTDTTPVRTSVPAFDQTTGLYTAPRLLSAANLQATVVAGGFNYNYTDPVSGGGICNR